MNISLLSFAFFLGTFKFMFAHWAIYGAVAGVKSNITIFEIFLAVTAGAWTCLTIFYFFSEYLIKRNKNKKEKMRLKAIELGLPIPFKKKFTRINKSIVWIKIKIGIYGLTIFAPLFLSIPLGAIVCAKFFGDNKKTYPLMLISTGTYSSLQCFLIYFIN